jgi:transposase
MKAYSVDLREKIVNAIENGESSFRKTAQRFSVSKSCVQKLVEQKRTQGHVVPCKQGGSVSALRQHHVQLRALVKNQPDATLAEYCERLFDETGLWVSQSTMCRTLQKLNLPRKKNAAPQSRQQ